MTLQAHRPIGANIRKKSQKNSGKPPSSSLRGEAEAIQQSPWIASASPRNDGLNGSTFLLYSRYAAVGIKHR